MRSGNKLMTTVVMCAVLTPAAAQEKERALVEAARKADLATASRLLQEGASPRAAIGPARAPLAIPEEPATAQSMLAMQTALCAAASAGSLEIARLLVAAGAEVNRAGPYGTPLAIAALRGDARLATMLLRAGADPNVRDGGGATPLYRAVLSGDQPLALRLLEAGADPNLRSAGVASVPPSSGLALIEAARRGDLELTRALLDAGAYPSTHGGDGRSALFWAIVQGTEEVALLLLERGANPAEWAGTYSMRHYAQAMGKPRVAEWIANREKTE
jgi:ankyrin repeat protein